MATEAPRRAGHPARLASRADVGGGLVLLTLEPGPDVRATYARAGQYVLLQTDDEWRRSGYFVLANDLGASTWEILIRPGGDSANAVLAAAAEGKLLTSPALGDGFPIEEARGRPLLIAATGGGIAAMRPVVGQRVREHDSPRTEVLLGVRARADVPLASEIEAWRAQGVRVTLCLSREEATGAPELASGYVQDVARRTAQSKGLQGGMIFAAGVGAMIEGMRALAKDVGVAEADVRTNY